jgi:hypothetical protein
MPDRGASAGGGGGSGFLGGAPGMLISGVREGDGAASITYDSDAGTCNAPVAPLAAVAPVALTASPHFTG